MNLTHPASRLPLAPHPVHRFHDTSALSSPRLPLTRSQRYFSRKGSRWYIVPSTHHCFIHSIPASDTAATMPVTIHCIRHAQGFHNLGTEFHSLLDPRLTPHGENQCADLQNASFQPDAQQQISLITASPLTRTLHTAYLTFQPLLDPTHPSHITSTNTPTVGPPQILALPDAQETSDFPCDTGSSPSELAAFLAQQSWPVDLSLLSDSWTTKSLGTRYSPNGDAVKRRARATRVQLRAKARELVDAGIENPQIVLVTHGGFLHYFTGDWEDASKGLGTGWVNCETREYEFEAGLDGSDEDEARIVETIKSRSRRGKEGPMAGWAEQEVLFEKAMQGWERSGLQRPDQIGVEGVEWKSGLAAGVGAGEAKGPGERQVESEEANKGEALERPAGIRVQA